MKTRNGFVSNSSTTSFCIYGIRLEEHPQKFKFSQYIKDYENEHKANIKRGVNYFDENKQIKDCGDIYYILEKGFLTLKKINF